MNIHDKMLQSMKWSTTAEIAAKIITPITNMILARILAPEAFGVLSTVIMVISFADVFVESGFQKYLIQHNFESKKEENEYMTVAFWSNLVFALFIWGIVSVFNKDIAAMLGAPDLGHLIIITGVTIPLYAMIGIQGSRLKKDLEFKTLFYVRMITAMIPLVVTVPLALLGLDYWALIIGNICGITAHGAALALLGRFKPMRFFSFSHLKNMLQHGIWTLLDGVAVWLTAWVDSFLIAQYMTGYHLGLYKNTTSTINSLFALVTAAVMPVLFATLSKLQDQKEEFNKTFLGTQKALGILLIPMGVGVYFYRDLATEILFGSGWREAANILGIMGITSALRTVFVSCYSDAYRAKGKFRIPLLLQIMDLCILIPSCVIAVRHGFWALVYVRAWIKLILILPEMVAAYKICGITPWMTIKNVLHPLFATGVMVLAILVLQTVSSTFLWSILSVALCIAIYFFVLFLFKEERAIIIKMVRRKS